ncbi:NAD-glutamate dehydrogenase [Pseudonocardia hispaniensis]|uniref:NAD-glutamate dehydrogenase n=1 Tax=Pseudonocardia hispaniensis TaxID=904933 RepID=A0ABW1IX23_9PSEU
MSHTRHDAAPAAADPELAELCRLYARHAPVETLGTDADASVALADAARTHRGMAAHREPDTPLLDVRATATGATVVDILTEDMPHLVESVLAGVGRVDARVRRMISPSVVVRRGADGELLEVLPAADEAPPDGATEAWMRIELDPFPLDEFEDLEAELRHVLTDVHAVARDGERMVDTARAIAAELAVAPTADAPDLARLLEWLADGHFLFLGYRRYRRDRRGHRLRAVAGSGLGVLRREEPSDPPLAQDRGTDAVVFTRASTPSRVLRPAYPYFVVIRSAGSTHTAAEEHRLLGLFTAAALRENVLDIPAVAGWVRAAINRAGFPLESYSGQRMLEVIADYPREELFGATVADLHETATGVLALTQPRRLRLFLRRQPDGRFVSCLVYLPRDRYTTRARLAMQDLLLRELSGWRIDHTARISESRLALVHFVVQVDPAAPRPDQARLQGQLGVVILTWDDWVLDLVGTGEDEIVDYLSRVPEGYKDDTDPVQALADLRRIRELGTEPHFELSLGDTDVRFRMFRVGAAVSLSAILPLLQDLGLEVLDERPYEITRPDGTRCWLYDFGLRLDEPTRAAVAGRPPPEVAGGFCAAFRAAWAGRAESDRFSALVLRVGLDWREAALLRAYARYARQLGSPYGVQYMAETLLAHAPVARALIALFRARFDPAVGDRDEAVAAALVEVRSLLDAVTGLDADRILRSTLAMIAATLRTNWFRGREFFSFKLDPAAVPDMPAPRPAFEIFVYSPRVEGVHLRFGPVARGGLRWSDRLQDYRTEILGLVKAQAVKNAVIVPVGAKGGFVVRRDPDPDEVAAGYRLFISGLLDVTDNLVDGATVAPPGVVRHDGDDAYLVVAADKGTARFSDLANEVAASYGFWLGDAFASGGSVGYDHKTMGITARGAWESVRRHFRELGVDTQSQEVTVVGIGDMSGDVFGNGMLRSRHIQLVAAFDHRHVFVDPDPDPATSHTERERLFALPRSSWDDYDRSLISAGGGVWPRTAKAVPVGPQMRAALGLAEHVVALSPPELIAAILRAPADLLWNGGIGTYVKASSESHADVGDKANDAIRADARDLRVKVVAEGGNLGFTQRGRIEFARAGGKINTDAIDNSAGVDCSDHEVNIKILLDRLVAAGELDREARARLLADMTDEVAELVLGDNRDQNAALGIARANAPDMIGVHARLTAELVARRGLDRELEVLPDADGFAALAAAGRGLTSPELATLLAHTKLDLTEQVLGGDLPDAPTFAGRLPEYFPRPLRERFPRAIARHPLRREIVTTMLVNEMVDGAGISYAFRLGEELAADPADAVRVYAVTTAVYELPGLWAAARAADIPVGLADRIVLESRRLLDRASRWFLTNRPQPLAVNAEIERFGPVVGSLLPRLPDLLRGRDAEALGERVEELTRQGVPRALALRSAVLPHGYGLLDVIDVAEVAAGKGARLPIEDVAALYFALSERR